MRLVKDARLLLPLTEVMKIARFTSPLNDVLCVSLSRPRLRHGRQLALLSRPSLTLNLCNLFFALSLALLPPPNFPNCSSPTESASIFAAYLRSHFSVSQPRVLRSRARSYLSELRRATCPEESHSSFCSLAEFHAPDCNFSSTATGQDKVAHLLREHLPRSGMDFLLHIFSLSFHLEDIFYYSHS